LIWLNCWFTHPANVPASWVCVITLPRVIRDLVVGTVCPFVALMRHAVSALRNAIALR
jgi:hypothetical protein